MGRNKVKYTSILLSSSLPAHPWPLTCHPVCHSMLSSPVILWNHCVLIPEILKNIRSVETIIWTLWDRGGKQWIMCSSLMIKRLYDVFVRWGGAVAVMSQVNYKTLARPVAAVITLSSIYLPVSLQWYQKNTMFRVWILGTAATDCLYVNSTLIICFLWWGGSLSIFKTDGFTYGSTGMLKAAERSLHLFFFFPLIYWRTSHSTFYHHSSSTLSLTWTGWEKTNTQTLFLNKEHFVVWCFLSSCLITLVIWDKI